MFPEPGVDGDGGGCGGKELEEEGVGGPCVINRSYIECGPTFILFIYKNALREFYCFNNINYYAYYYFLKELFLFLEKHGFAHFITPPKCLISL